MTPVRAAAALAICLTALGACTSNPPQQQASTRPVDSQATSTSPIRVLVAPSAAPTPTRAVVRPSGPATSRATHHRASTTPVARTATASPRRTPASTHRPVIVLDPGHSPGVQSVDRTTGLVDSDYENDPEMRDVFAVAELVRTQLEHDGYRVVMTKNKVTDRVSLGQRAAVANSVHAALAVSIHDQAGSNGGIQFNQGNNIVYFQSVGGYRETPNGTRITFTNSQVAATSKRYGQIFQMQRAAAEGHQVRLQGDVGYNLGTRGLAPGDMWIVQLLSRVPWIYNEAGGNSADQSGLDATDKQKYARGLVASIEHCVPVARRS